MSSVVGGPGRTGVPVRGDAELGACGRYGAVESTVIQYLDRHIETMPRTERETLARQPAPLACARWGLVRRVLDSRARLGRWLLPFQRRGQPS